jgi:hypothetical protein
MKNKVGIKVNYYGNFVSDFLQFYTYKFEYLYISCYTYNKNEKNE